MTQTASIDEAIEVFDRLTDDDRAQLLDLYIRRRIEAERARMQADMDEARRERAGGTTRAMSPEEIMSELRS